MGPEGGKCGAEREEVRGREDIRWRGRREGIAWAVLVFT